VDPGRKGPLRYAAIDFDWQWALFNAGRVVYVATHNEKILLPNRPGIMDDTRLKLMEAIARKRLVTAHYNGQVLTLAPHLLFERRGDLFISALNLNKSWRSDEDPRLGHFKLGGLASIELSEEEFVPLPGFEPAPPRDEDTPLLAV
jgi:hypothetical protein